jgi:negative regulator of genetic competence, sporulation and motility
MKSKYYLELLLKEYEKKELTKNDLKSTLIHYAKLYHNEKKNQNKTSGV